MSKEHNDCIDFNASASVHDCESTRITPVCTTPGRNNQVIMKVPITLAERTVSTSLSANINFPHPVLEIKDIKKRVKIVQCSLVLKPAASVAKSFCSCRRPFIFKRICSKKYSIRITYTSFFR